MVLLQAGKVYSEACKGRGIIWVEFGHGLPDLGGLIPVSLLFQG